MILVTIARRLTGLFFVLVLAACEPRAMIEAPGNVTRAMALPALISRPAGACATDVHAPLKVMTFNIRVGYGIDDPKVRPDKLMFRHKDLEPIIAAIRDADPDVVALQEIMANGQARQIADALGMNYVFGYHPSPVPWWGTAILSKCPIVADRTIAVSRSEGNMRNALVATVAFGGGGLNFVSLHRDPDVNDGTQLRNALANIGADRVNTVIMGDFNVGPQDERLSILQADFTDTGAVADTPEALRAREGGTMVAHHAPKRRIDYIWVPRTTFQVLDSGLTDPAFRAASDHWGYWAEIQRM